MESARGKVVLITGASSGIGAALARDFASRGADLVLLARRTDRLEALAQELSPSGTKVFVCKADVTQDGELEFAVSEAHRVLGRKIDIAIANAGFGVVGAFEDLELSDYRRQFETNIFGLIRTVKAVLPDLRATRGHLALVGSVAGHISLPEGSPYSMSKFAVRALSNALWHELARDGIRVTLISPGFVESELRQVDNKGNWHEPSARNMKTWIHVPTDRAAAEIARGILRGKREKVITAHGKLFVLVYRLFPGALHRLMRLAGARNRPEPS